MTEKVEKLPEQIPVFPLSNFIIFPETTTPLNIFEPRYIQMVDDAMKSHRIIGMIQPKKKDKIPSLYDIGCAGKITSFHEAEDGRYLIVLVGVSRFKITEELNTDKLYRVCKVSFNEFNNDLKDKKEEIKFSDLKFIFKDFRFLLNKKGYVVNWKELEKQNLDQTINTLSMLSPFSLEEKQVLLETINLFDRKKKLEEILKTYINDSFSNKTLQ